MATNQGTTPSDFSPTPTTPEANLRSVITDALYDLEWGVVRPLATQVQVEHALLDSNDHPSVRAEIATRRAARVLGTVASIILKIEAAAKQVAVLFLLAVIASAAFAQSGPTCVPFQVVNHRTIIQVEVNGHGPFSFLLDTGAQTTMLSPEVFRISHLKTVGFQSLYGIGATNTHVNLAQVTLKVAGQTAADVKAIEYDMSQAQGPEDPRFYGILGQNFLEQFTATIDYQHSCLSLQ